LYYGGAVISVVHDLQKITKIYSPHGKASLAQQKAYIPQNAKNMTSL